MKDIAIEKGLTSIKEYLENSGYNVYEIDVSSKSNKDFTDGFDAVVLSGINNNFLGIEDTSTNAPVISASGLSFEDIKARIEQSSR